MTDRLRQLVVENVDLNETDEDLWDWVVTNVLIKTGFHPIPGMKYTVERTGTTARVHVDMGIPDEIKTNA